MASDGPAPKNAKQPRRDRPSGLEAAVHALAPAWHPHYFEAVESTQDVARSAAREGAPDRSIFVADYQRAGRGRHGRVWLAPPGSALLLSLVFREAAVTPAPWHWTSLASVALVEAIEQLVPGANTGIKWPNDVMLGGAKVAGILAETRWDGSELQAIVGIGVNVNSEAADLAQIPAATSLRIIAGEPIDRGRLIRALIGHLDEWLQRPPEDLHAAWERRLWRRGQRLRLADLGRVEEVVVLGAGADGSLRVRLADGTERCTTTGELLP